MSIPDDRSSAVFIKSISCVVHSAGFSGSVFLTLLSTLVLSATAVPNVTACSLPLVAFVA